MKTGTKYYQGNNRELMAAAEDMFVVKGMGIAEISRVMKINCTTLGRWREREGWVAKKSMHQNVFRNTLITLEHKLEQLTADLDKLNLQDDEFSSKTDGIAKLLGQIIKLRGHYEQDKMKQTVDVMSEFAVFVRKLDLPDDKVDVIELAMDGFFAEMRKKSA